MGLEVRRQHREETVSRKGLAVPEQDGAYNFSAVSQGEPMAVEEPTVMGETHKEGGVGSTTPKSPNPRTFLLCSIRNHVSGCQGCSHHCGEPRA